MKVLYYLQYVIIAYLIIAVSSCKEESIEFGKSVYHPGFLWDEEEQICAEKTFIFDFSQDAINDTKTFAEFAFVSNDGNLIDTDCLQTYIENKKLSNNTFRVESTTDSVRIRFEFSPDSREGKYQGFLRLVDHNLDRIDSHNLTPLTKVDVLQWSLYFEKNINPIVKILLWILGLFITGIIIWFCFIRPIFYPHFGKFKKSVIVIQNGKTVFHSMISFTGTQKVIFSDKIEKQSFWNRLFFGHIKTVICPYFTSKIVITPYKKNAIAIGQNCNISPNPFPRNGVVTIKCYSSNIVINLK